MTNRKISFEVICCKCRNCSTNHFPLTAPDEAYIGINTFKEVLINEEIVCSYCSEKGSAVDDTKFELIRTTGLDDNLIQNHSTLDKLIWFQGLEFIIKHYLNEIFNPNKNKNIAIENDLYQCRFILKRQCDLKPTLNQPAENYEYYKIIAIVLKSGENKTVEGDFYFMHKNKIQNNLEGIVIINPHKYHAHEIINAIPNSFLSLIELKD
ncbi:hypothetical protein [Maribacter stanieri]|uniref:CpXC domain-containing protein n=1 Tax=Maribacter stanieri TaxID=440514 RepID=A0A1I6I6D7_9FLAO|nr:hypothetical protein [Maribacter stanieri]SFR62305.1 hypothetical protein SAMN04488010_1197 [Maribacter stanieri]